MSEFEAARAGPVAADQTDPAIRTAPRATNTKGRLNRLKRLIKVIDIIHRGVDFRFEKFSTAVRATDRRLKTPTELVGLGLGFQ